jgi:hypothetical protein
LIGNVGLGMSDTRIEYAYGSPLDRFTDRGADWRGYRGQGRIEMTPAQRAAVRAELQRMIEARKALLRRNR